MTVATAASTVPAPPADVAVPLSWEAGTKVLVVSGGSSHDFKRWFNAADVATLQARGKIKHCRYGFPELELEDARKP